MIRGRPLMTINDEKKIIATKMMITIARGERERGGQRVMIEVIISENDDNGGQSLKPC